MGRRELKLVGVGAVRTVAVVVVVADKDPDDGAQDEAAEDPHIHVFDALSLTNAAVSWRNTGISTLADWRGTARNCAALCMKQ